MTGLLRLCFPLDSPYDGRQIRSQWDSPAGDMLGAQKMLRRFLPAYMGKIDLEVAQLNHPALSAQMENHE
jgi:hypothetical protein